MIGREHEKLLLEALMYSLDDMPPQERKAFEQRLVTDQAAREAVAEAVLMCQITDRVLHEMTEKRAEMAEKRADRRAAEFFDPAFSGPAPGVPTNGAAGRVQSAAHVDGIWRRKAVWAALAVAASILVALVVGIGRERTMPDGNGGHIASADGESNPDGGKLLAVAWLNSAALTGSPDDFANDEVVTDEAAGDEAVSEDDDEVAMLDTGGVDTTDTLESDASMPEDDWLFEAVTAPTDEAAGANVAKPQEG